MRLGDQLIAERFAVAELALPGGLAVATPDATIGARIRFCGGTSRPKPGSLPPVRRPPSVPSLAETEGRSGLPRQTLGQTQPVWLGSGLRLDLRFFSDALGDACKRAEHLIVVLQNVGRKPFNRDLRRLAVRSQHSQYGPGSACPPAVVKSLVLVACELLLLFAVANETRCIEPRKIAGLVLLSGCKVVEQLPR